MLNCIEVSACTYFLFVIAEKKEEDLFNDARFRELGDVIAPNGILVIPGKKAIIGRGGKSIKLEGVQILKSLNNKNIMTMLITNVEKRSIRREASISYLKSV